ncbi:MAG: endonuclease [Flavobacteriales bacterium]
MKKQYTIGFYNLENLFDIIDDPETMDDDFTPDSSKKWTQKRYENKLHKLAKAIKLLGDEDSLEPPVMLGVAEVENKKVLNDLIKKTELKAFQYGIVHFDSPDERGIDVGFIYRKKNFMVLHKESHSVYLEDEKGIQDTTRDILHVNGLLDSELIDILITHWPSKRNEDINEQKRLKVADKVRAIIECIFKREPGGNIIVMGDFNDNPDGKSLKKLKIKSDFYNVQREELFNPMIELAKEGKGTLTHKNQWSLFDQILLSKALISGKRNFKFKKVAIFNPRLLQEWEKPYQGEPFRTYVGKKYLGGYSDHFPVYIVLEK